MTRPKKGGDEKRDIIVRVRFTMIEKQKLVEAADNAGLTPSDFVRVKTLGAAPVMRKPSPEREGFIKALAELGKIGSNVNQVSRALNRKNENGEGPFVSKETIEYTMRRLDLLTTHVLKLLDYDGH